MSIFVMIAVIAIAGIISKTIVRLNRDNRGKWNVGKNTLSDEDNRYIHSLENRIEFLESQVDTLQDQADKLEEHYDFVNKLLEDKK